MLARRLFPPLAGLLLLFPGLEARFDPQGSGPVVLDLVVRDKKGIEVVDLAASEIEVYEDGAKQTFEGFHRVAADARPRLVVLLFPRLPHAERPLAQAAADEFIKKQLGTGLSAAVLNVGSELVPVQEFTTDAAVLKDAVKRALADSAKSGYPNAQVLFSLVDWLKDQPGRKTAVLFSAGLAIPVGFDDVVETLAGLANRHRISFYGIDTRGLELSRGGMNVAQDSPGVATEVWSMGGGSRVNEDLRGYGVNVGRDTPDAKPQALATLAAATGGFVMERSNSFSKPMREIAEDARGHYELTYTPAASKSDAGLRKTEIKVARDGASVQARQGYLVGEATAVPAFEKRLTAALGAEPLARELQVWDRVLRYAWNGRDLTHVVWVAVPLEKVSLVEDKQAGRFKGDVAVLARVKDASGGVVATFSRPYALDGPLDQVARAHTQSIPFVRRVELAPGEYTLETAVRDEGGGKVAARRTPFEAKAPAGIALSSLSLGDLVPAGPDADPDDPLRIGNQRLVPNIGQPIKAGQPAMTLYSIVYPVAGSKDAANITIAVLLGDQLVNTATAKLPAPDAKGRIPYATALRMDVLPPGTYRFKVAVDQGSSRAEESLAFTIVP